MAIELPAGWSVFTSGCDEPEVCTDLTERGQVALAPAIAFLNDSTKGTNLLTEWSYISPGGELYALIGQASCGGGNMSYNDTCMEINYFNDEGSVTSRELVVNPDNGPMNPPPIGSSDEPFYFSKHGQNGYYPVSGTTVSMNVPGGNGWQLTTYAKRDTHFYAFGVDYGAGDPDFRVGDFNASSGAFISYGVDGYSFDLTLFNQTNGCATDTYLYCLTSLISDTTVRAVKKLNRSDLTLAASFDLTNISPRWMYAIDDSLVYVLTDTSPMALYYIKDFTTLVYVGSFTSLNNTSFAGNQGFFTNGSFYWGSVGISGFSTNIAKVPLPCPEAAALVASMTVSGVTVVAGAALTVSWADVLEPTAVDKIYLRAAPGAGELGFIGTIVDQETTDGAGTSSMSFTIPGGTTPGNYVFQYVYRGANYVMSSAVFAVT